MSDKQTYEKKLSAKLDEWQADIDKLKAKAEGTSAEAQAEYHRELRDLRDRRDAVHAKLQDVQSASVEAWSDVKKGADAAWDSMSDAMQSAWKRFS